MPAKKKMCGKVAEIFSSLQGEGKYLGTRQVFLRLAGCDFDCVWCDTPLARRETPAAFETLNVLEVLARVRALAGNCRSVSVTGGEPLLQKDFLKAFLPRLKQVGFAVHLETNGICFRALKEVISSVDVVAMDIKLPSSTKCRPCWMEHEEFLKIAKRREVFIKAVITLRTEKKDVARMVRLIKGIAPDVPLFLQPNTRELRRGVLMRCLEFQNYCLKHLPDVRITPQMHKILGVR